MLIFLPFVHYPNFSITTNCGIDNDQHNDLFHEVEAWTWYSTSPLEVAKILCSRCEQCTN